MRWFLLAVGLTSVGIMGMAYWKPEQSKMWMDRMLGVVRKLSNIKALKKVPKGKTVV